MNMFCVKKRNLILKYFYFYLVIYLITYILKVIKLIIKV